jgi:hypothetical protein
VNVAGSQRVHPGEKPIACQPGVLEVSVRSRTGRPLRLEVRGDLAIPLRPVGQGRWLLELTTGGSGRLYARDTTFDVFPDDSVLTITIVLPGGRRLNVHPAPDVSSLRGTDLVRWDTATTPEGGAPTGQLLVGVPDVETQAGELGLGAPGGYRESAPDQNTPQHDVDVLGESATRARNVARQVLGAPRLAPDQRRDVHVVIDRSTSMRSPACAVGVQNAVCVVSGVAAVTAEHPPSVFLAGGIRLDEVAAPNAPVAQWARATLLADAFGFSLDRVQRAMPPGHPRRDIVVITDDVPADLDLLRENVPADGSAGRWRVIALDVAPGEADGDRAGTPVEVLPACGREGDRGGPAAHVVTAIVDSLVPAAAGPSSLGG